MIPKDINQKISRCLWNLPDKGEPEDLSAYSDGAFDLVMSFGTPISYTWPHQETVIGELVRIAGEKVMFSVSSRLGYLPYLANPIQKNQFILDSHCPDPWVQQLIAGRPMELGQHKNIW